VSASKQEQSAKEPKKPPRDADAHSLLVGFFLSIPFAVVVVGALVWLIFLGPEVLLDFLGPRLSDSLFGIALVIAGVLLGGRMWYVTSRRGRKAHLPGGP
jgi:hypothetical protein